MVFAICVVPLLAVAGFAVDYSRHVSIDGHVQMAVDSASLAAARALEDASLSDGDVIKIARASFDTNTQTAGGSLDCGTASVSIDRDTGLVEVGANCDMPAFFGGVLERDRLEVSNAAIAQASITKLDLALMLDVSGSMGGQKLTDLKSAAKAAAAKLITSRSGDRVRIGFDSYASAVNAGTYAADVFPAGFTSTCATERTGMNAWTDDGPAMGRWLGNDTSYCPSSSVLPLTSDLDVFNTAIDSLSAGGSTAGHIGVAWSWYLISPAWKDIWPAISEPLPYGNVDTKKAVILMTDGQFNTRYEPGLGDSNQQAKKMCKKMRDKGILVYAVAFQAPSSAKATLEDCAGDPARFFDASDGAELQAAYDAIASELANLSLVG